jgi:hypothetical protein
MEGLLHNHPVQFAVPPEHEELSILRARGNCRELVRNTASDIVAAGNQLISTVSLCAV